MTRRSTDLPAVVLRPRNFIVGMLAAVFSLIFVIMTSWWVWGTIFGMLVTVGAVAGSIILSLGDEAYLESMARPGLDSAVDWRVRLKVTSLRGCSRIEDASLREEHRALAASALAVTDLIERSPSVVREHVESVVTSLPVLVDSFEEGAVRTGEPNIDAEERHRIEEGLADIRRGMAELENSARSLSGTVLEGAELQEQLTHMVSQTKAVESVMRDVRLLT